jgi:hypothetical protein
VSCERVAFSRIGGSGKAAQIPEEGNGRRERESGMGWERPGEQGHSRECTPIRVMAPNVRKNATHKESSQEKSHVHKAKFNGRPKLPGWLGKRWRSTGFRPGVAFIEGRG